MSSIPMIPMIPMIPPFINLIHILLVGPLLIYIGQQGKNTPPVIFSLLLGLAAGVFAYHAWLLHVRQVANPINLFHIALVAPFLGYLGWYGAKSDNRAFQAVGIVGFVVVAYHAYRWYLKTSELEKITNEQQ